MLSFFRRLGVLGCVVVLVSACAPASIGTPALPPLPTVCLLNEPIAQTSADDRDPQPSVDERRFAFVGHHEGNPEVYLITRGMFPPHNISNTPFDDYAPIWSPDNRFIAYMHRAQQYTRNPSQIRLYEVETGITRVIMPRYANISHPLWAQGGRALIFRREQDVIRYDTETGQMNVLMSYPNPYVSGDVGTLSPDGETLAISMWVGRGVEVMLINTRDGSVEHTNSADFLNYISLLSWSPDGTRLAMAQGSHPGPLLLLYDRHTALTFNPARGSRGAVFNVEWSPDGRLAWTQNIMDEHNRPHTRLFVAGADLTHPRELLSVEHNIDQIAWSPSRDQIAFNTYAGVYVADVASGLFHDFIQGWGRVSAITWSGSGNYLASFLISSPRFISGVALVDVRTGARAVYGRATSRGWINNTDQLLVERGERGNLDIDLLTLCDL